MKILNLFIFSFCFLAIFSSVNSKILRSDLERDGKVEANMNDYFDMVMEDVGPWLVENGMDPMDLPDMFEYFSHKPLLITYHGELNLTKGVLSNLKNISRYGDAIMAYNYKMLRVSVGVSMKSLQFRYDYDVSVMNLGPNGWLSGTVKNMDITCDFIIDMTDFYVFMQEFKVANIGKIDVKVHGNILIDWLGNVIIKIVTTLFRTTITEYVSDSLFDFVQGIIDAINAGMGNIGGDRLARQKFVYHLLDNLELYAKQNKV